MLYAYVAVGSALGGMARYGLGEIVTGMVGVGFPWGTLLINISGSLVIGLFAALSSGDGERLIASPEMRTFVMVGLCGGFTTFSAFSLQTLQLAQSGQTLRAGAYVIGSVGLCLAFVWIGVRLGQGLAQP